MKDQCIGINIKQKVRIKKRQTSIDIFLNQTLQELTDCLFKLIQIKMTMQKGIKPEGIIYPKVSLRIMASSPTEKILWPPSWFWYITTQRNKKINNMTRWGLSCKMFVGLWLNQKLLQTKSSWFDQTKRIDAKAI